MVGARAGETTEQRFARTQANVKSAAAQTSRVASPAPGSAAPVMRANKGQVYANNKLVADYGYGSQAEAIANRYVQTRGQSFGPIARSEGQAVTPELAPYSPQPTVAPIVRTPKPVANVTPVDRNIDAETAAREQIATERGIDTTKASAATLSLLNEAVNQNVYGKARPTFNRSAITPGPTASKPVVADTFTPDEVQSIVTSDSAEKYRADELANITDLQSESFDTAASGFDGLMSTDSEILDVQYAGMDAQALLEQRRAFYQDQYISLKSEISRIYGEKANDYKQQAAQQMGSTISQLASMGALGTTTAGVQYVNDVERINQAKLVSFAAEEAAALESAFNAFQEADFKTAQEMIDNAKATREEIRLVKTESLANQQKMMELKKLEREETSQTISAMVDSGLDISTLPPGYLNYLDAKGGFVPGTSEGLWQMATKERTMKDVTDQQAIQQTSLENAAKMVAIMSSLPVGQSVELDGVTYSSLNTGEVQTGTEQGVDGRTYLWSYNKETGETKTTDLGIVGSKKYTDIQSNEGAIIRVYEDGSQRIMFDPTQYNGGTAEGGLIEAFPNMTLSPFTRGPGGDPYQCGAWVNDVTGLGVGDSFENKMSLMDPSITSDTAGIGDVFVQPIGSTGHIGIINGKSIVNGEVVFTVSESNWKKDGQGRGLITHTRQVKASQVSGYARPGFKNPQYNFGTDSPGFTFGDQPVETEAPNLVTINGKQMVWDSAYGQYVEPTVAGGTTVTPSLSSQDIAKTPEAKKLQGIIGLNSAISSYKKLIEEKGTAGSFSPTDRNLLDSAKEKINLAIKEAEALGALQAPDIELITRMIPDVTKDNILSSLMPNPFEAGRATKVLDQVTSQYSSTAQSLYKLLLAQGSGLENDPYIQELARQLGMTGGSQGTIRVRQKSSGQTGTIPESEFDETLYERI